jgi:hypothetical protein
MARNRAPAATGDPSEVEEVFDPDAGDLDHLTLATPDWRWVVYRKLRPEEKSVFPGQHSVMLCKLEGAVDLDQIKREYGGGTYEFWGTIIGQRGLQAKPVISLAGELKPAAVPPERQVAPATAPAAAVNGTSPEMVAVLAGIQRQLEKLSDRPVAPASPAFGIAEMLQLFQVLRGNEPDPKAQIEGMLGLVKTGIQLGSEREPSEPPDAGMVILEKVMPSLENLATAILTRGRGAPPRRPPVPAQATVVDGQPVPQAQPVASADELEREARMVTLVGSLARAITQSIHVIDFADTVAAILPDDELFLVKQSTAEALLTEIQQKTGDRFPALATPAGREYVEALLAELRNPTSDVENDS